MTPEQIELMRKAAQSLLDHKRVGRKCDPHAVKWAEQVLRNNQTQDKK
jgi:hypothetical protein